VLVIGTSARGSRHGADRQPAHKIRNFTTVANRARKPAEPKLLPPDSGDSTKGYALVLLRRQAGLAARGLGLPERPRRADVRATIKQGYRRWAARMAAVRDGAGQSRDRGTRRGRCGGRKRIDLPEDGTAVGPPRLPAQLVQTSAGTLPPGDLTARARGRLAERVPGVGPTGFQQQFQ